MAQYKLGYACALWHDYLSYSIRVRSVILTSWQDHDHIFAFFNSSKYTAPCLSHQYSLDSLSLLKLSLIGSAVEKISLFML